MSNADTVAKEVQLAVQDWKRRSGHPRSALYGSGFVVSARSTYGGDWAIRAQMMQVDSNERQNTSNGVITITPEPSSGLSIFAPGYNGRRLLVVGVTGGLEPNSATGVELRWSAYGAGGTSAFTSVTWLDGNSVFYFETEEIADSQNPSISFQLANNLDDLSIDIYSLTVLPSS